MCVIQLFHLSGFIFLAFNYIEIFVNELGDNKKIWSKMTIYFKNQPGYNMHKI